MVVVRVQSSHTRPSPASWARVYRGCPARTQPCDTSSRAMIHQSANSVLAVVAWFEWCVVVLWSGEFTLTSAASSAKKSTRIKMKNMKNEKHEKMNRPLSDRERGRDWPYRCRHETMICLALLFSCISYFSDLNPNNSESVAMLQPYQEFVQAEHVGQFRGIVLAKDVNVVVQFL